MNYLEKVKYIGTGVIISENGYIITNYHVIENAKDIIVTLYNKKNYRAKVVGYDKINDLALLKINVKGLKSIKFSNKLPKVGEWVIALGYPLGYININSSPSASIGIISAINLDFNFIEEGHIYRNMIQTDASINPGNSGGPLINLRGSIVGINTFIITRSGGNEGIAFAIPSYRVKLFISEILKYGKVRDLYLGLKVKKVQGEVLRVLGLNINQAVVISNIDKNSPAEKSGLKVGDIILKINGMEINKLVDIGIALVGLYPGEKVNFLVYRKGKYINKLLKLSGKL